MDIDQMMDMASKYTDDAPDMVNSPPHYEICEVLTVYQLRQMLAEKAEKFGMDYAAFSDWDRALEYLLRAPFKNGAEDIDKSMWYADKLADKLSKGK
jgi:hypothetical protein